jgi:hypothetical protein
MSNLLNVAIDSFIETVNERIMESDAKNTGYPNYHGKGIYKAGGNKYLRLNIPRGGQVSVYCFVALVDVPKKRVKAGDILMAATYKAPALNVKNPKRGSVFEPDSYAAADAYTGWLYQK